MVLVFFHLVIRCAATQIKPDQSYRLSKRAKFIVRYLLGQHCPILRGRF